MPTTPVPPPTATSVAGAFDELSTWLAGVASTAIHIGSPEADAGTRLCLWPLALVSDHGTRGGYGLRTLRLRVRHAVYADGPFTESLPLLDRVLEALAANERFQLVPDPVPDRLWGTFAPRPALLVDVPLSVVAATPTAPRVVADITHRPVGMRTIAGQVVTATGVTLAGMKVASSYTGTSVLTDSSGGFALAGQPAGRAVALQLSGRGLRFGVEVGPETANPVVIRCPNPSEEV